MDEPRLIHDFGGKLRCTKHGYRVVSLGMMDYCEDCREETRQIVAAIRAERDWENRRAAERTRLRKLAKRQAVLAVEIAERELMMELVTDG